MMAQRPHAGPLGLLEQVLAPSERDELLAVMETRHWAPGAPLFHQDTVSDGAFVIRRGHVRLELTVPGGAPVTVATLGGGDLLGEPALLDDRRRMLSAYADDAVTACFLHRLDFQALLASYRPVSLRVVREIARLTASRLVRTDVATAQAQSASGRSNDDAPWWADVARRHTGFDPRPFLPHFAFFRDFTASDLDALLELGSTWDVPRGARVIRRGDAPSGCWLVVRGAVEVRNARGHRVGLFGPGEAFGEVGALLDAPTSADCIVREDAVLLEIDDTGFARLFSPEDRVSFKFAAAVARGLQGSLARADRVLARSALAARTLDDG